MVQSGTVPELLFGARPGADAVAIAAEDGAGGEAVLLRDGLFEDTADGSFGDFRVIVAGARVGDVALRLRCSCRSACGLHSGGAADCEGKLQSVYSPQLVFLTSSSC